MRARARSRRRKGGDRSSGGDAPRELPKARSGIKGLDEITGGGLPRGRPTLVCGGPGCGKTLFAMEFLVRGAAEYGEPGVFMSFEETAGELAANVASLGFDLKKLEAQKKLSLDFVRVERSEIEETGEYDLEGLFVRLGHAIDTVGAQRVVLDTIESLFAGLSNAMVLRSELRRLFRWLKDRGMTVVLTGEQGEGKLTREGLEEYVSDCVIFLDHRVREQVSTRRLRIVKYRGSTHGTNEYPFLIDAAGVSVLPITSMALEYDAPDERVSSGIPRLDEMLGGRGYYAGSTILVSGTAGAGKTSTAAHLALDFARRGKRAIFFALEEAPAQILRNMASIGLDLAPHKQRGMLRIIALRPESTGLETHLATMQKDIADMDPELVIMDPISNLVGSGPEARALLTRLIDFLKSRRITALLTDLTAGGADLEQTNVGISSLIDTWLVLEMRRTRRERRRVIHIVKSRGMAHSNEGHEFRLSDEGLRILDASSASSGEADRSARPTRRGDGARTRGAR